MNETIRRTAEVSEDLELLAPEVEIIGDVDEAIVEAVEAAIEANPNNLDAPRLVEEDGDSHAVARLEARYNEIPVSTGDDPEAFGWLAPYRAREEVDEALREELPEGVQFEARNNSTTDFYSEVEA